MQIEKTPARTEEHPEITRFTLTYEELFDIIRKSCPDFPQGGLFKVSFNPNTERLTIIHT